MRDMDSSIMRMLCEWIEYIVLLLFAIRNNPQCPLDAQPPTEEIGIFYEIFFFHRLVVAERRASYPDINFSSVIEYRSVRYFFLPKFSDSKLIFELNFFFI